MTLSARKAALVQVFLYGGNSMEDQLGDSWYLDVAASTWQQVAVNADQGKAWHQTSFVPTPEVHLHPHMTLCMLPLTPCIVLLVID